MTSISTLRILYLWHLVDGLTHLFLESTYVYNCFTTYIAVDATPDLLRSPQVRGAPRIFLGQASRLYGNAYSDNMFGSLWTLYARADSRYSGIDLTTLSLEIITVFVAGPLALYVAMSMRDKGGKWVRGKAVSNVTWFWATVLASMELYGGIMNFLPEALSGWSSLDMDDAVHLWVYIVLSNAVWVLFPVWVLKTAHRELGRGVTEVKEKRR